jgi:hypothetical protein
MRLADAAPIAFLLITLAGRFSASASEASHLAASDVASEIKRGFQISGLCIRGSERPLHWYANFRKMLGDDRKHRDDSPGFLLGANFGFSFRAEASAEQAGARQDELQRLAAYALVTRLEFERLKKHLGLTDANVIQLVGVSAQRFAEWRNRAATNDNDTSVVKNQRELQL